MLNYARTADAPTEQLSPALQQRLHAQNAANETEWLMRGISDPDWFSPLSGNTNLTPLCTSWMMQCAGDPFRYPGVDPFYENEAEVTPLVIYDQDCARLNGRVWAPKGSKAGDGLPVDQLTIQGSTHFEWSLIPTFPASSWCPEVVDGQCAGGWGRPLAEHYSVAWFDRWLKKPGEPGYDTADTRLLADADWVERYSFYSKAARAFPSRDGNMQLCEDIRAGCEIANPPVVIVDPPPSNPPPSNPPPAVVAGEEGRFGGSMGFSLLLLLWPALRRRSR